MLAVVAPSPSRGVGRDGQVIRPGLGDGDGVIRRIAIHMKAGAGEANVIESGAALRTGMSALLPKILHQARRRR